MHLGISSPLKYTLDHSTVFSTASSTPHLGFHPNTLLILEQSSLRKLASCGALASALLIHFTQFPFCSFLFHFSQNKSTSRPVVIQSLSSGPTL